MSKLDKKKKKKTALAYFSEKLSFSIVSYFVISFKIIFSKLIFEIMGYCEAVDVDKSPTSFLEPLQRNKCLMSVWKSDENCSFLHPSFLLLKSFCLRSNIKHEMQCFTTGEAPPSSSKIPLRVVFLTLSSVFHLVMKDCIQ